jgi:hypothetical protein
MYRKSAQKILKKWLIFLLLNFMNLFIKLTIESFIPKLLIRDEREIAMSISLRVSLCSIMSLIMVGILWGCGSTLQKYSGETKTASEAVLLITAYSDADARAWKIPPADQGIYITEIDGVSTHQTMVKKSTLGSFVGTAHEVLPERHELTICYDTTPEGPKLNAVGVKVQENFAAGGIYAVTQDRGAGPKGQFAPAIYKLPVAYDENMRSYFSRVK